MEATTPSNGSSLWIKAHPVRKVIREILAAAFWIHAVYLLHFVALPNSFSSSLPRYLYNSALVLFILYYSFFSDRGWLSVIYDIFYIYFWPFTMAIRLIWITSKRGYAYMRRQVVISQPPNLIIPSSIAAVPVASTQTAETKKVISAKPIIERLRRPFTQFVILWSILILTVDNKAFIIVASIVTLIGAAKAIWNLWDLLSDTSSWIETLKGNFASQFAINIAQVRQWNEGADSAKTVQVANVLKFWESLLTFVSDNKDFLARCTIVIAAFISIPFYCYISFLFSCVYFGLAKMQGLTWSWPSALSDALYMPFAFTDLPHNFTIRFIGGLQAIAVSIMGWGIFTRHLSGKFERIALAASELRSSFQDDLLQAKIKQLESAVSVAKIEKDQVEQIS